MRIAIAPRVSSEMQAERGWSFEDQLARGQEWASREGHTITAIYGQPGVSAGTANRDELLQIVAGAANNDWDALWIRDLMRFTRSPDDIRHLRAIEFNHGKRIFEDGRPITLLTAEGELDVGVRVQLGAYQLAQIRKLTSHGKKARATAGKHNFSVPPTGYEIRDGVPVPRADNAEAVRLIFSLFRSGAFSVRDLVERINAKGYKTNAGRPFGADTINAILRNKFYSGYVGYRGLVPVYTQSKRPRASKKQVEWVKGEHAPLIDESTWEECERIRLARSGQRAGRATKQHRVYLLQGLARCAGCNQPMRAHASEYEKEKYRCTSRERGLPCASAHSYIAESKIEPALDDRMARLVLPDLIKQRILEVATQADTAQDIFKERRRIEAQIERAKQLFELGDYTMEQYQARKAELQGRLSELKVPEITDVQLAIDLLNDSAAMWIGATREEKRDVLRSLFDAVMIDIDKAEAIFVPKPALAPLLRLIDA